MALTLHAACHERALCGVEAAYGSTGNGKEKAGEERVLRNVAIRAEPSGIAVEVARAKVAPQFGKVRHLDEQAYHQCHGHEQQREGEEGIYLANDLVDGQHRGDDIIDEDDHDPQHLRPAHAMKDDGGTVDEDYADHH